MKLIYLFVFVFIFFNSVAQENRFVCGTKDDALPLEIRQKMQNLPELLRLRNARVGSEEPLICRIAVEIDSETYQRYGQDTTGVIRDVYESIAQTSKVFEREINTRLVVTSIRIWKDQASDPYFGIENIFSMLDRLVTTPPLDSNFDKRVYLFTKNVTGASGVAYLGGQLSVSPMGYYRTIMHEFGHNFGSPHTHDCSWPGGPIDYCVETDGGCYDKSLDIITNGSIMSYCSGENTFHPLCQALMRSQVERYLQKAQSAPSNVTGLRDISISKSDYLSWPVVATATSYDVSYADNPDFQGAATYSSPFNYFPTKNLLQKGYYYRIRAVNSFGNSDWSGSRILNITAKEISPPEIAGQNEDIIPANGAVNLSYSSVEGATGYEIQVFLSMDAAFSNLTFSAETQETNFSYMPPFSSCYKWRVRALKGDQKGPWSQAAFFAVNPSYAGRFFSPMQFENQNITRDFPFTYQPVGYFSDVKITIADNATMANPIFVKTYHQHAHIVEFVKNLPPNTTLFLRMEETNADRSYFPPGHLVDQTIVFTTGQRKLPSNITFLSDLNRDVFGFMQPMATLTKDNIWITQPNSGFIKLDQRKLTYERYTRDNTDGLLGFNYSVIMKGSQTQGIQIMTQGNYGSLRINDLKNEDPKTPGEIFIHSRNIIDFDEQTNLYWSSTTIFKKVNGILEPVKVYDDTQPIRQAVVWRNKMWVLLSMSNGATGAIAVLDVNTLAVLETIDYTKNNFVKQNITQIQIDHKGSLWLKQYDPLTNINSIGYFDGQNWRVFDYTNSALGPNLIHMNVSPAGQLYVLQTGSESIISKYTGSGWVQVGSPIPYVYFGNELLVDDKENVWINGIFGIVRMTSCPPMDEPLVTGIKSLVDYGEEVSLKITNCPEGQLWSWTNSEVTVKDSLVRNNGTLALKLLSNTTFSARCGSKNCSSADTVFTIETRPELTLISTNKQNYCKTDSIQVVVSVKGTFDTGNVFTAMLNNDSGVQLSVPNLASSDNQIRFKIPANMTRSRVGLKIKSSSPEVISVNSLGINVYEIPTATLSSNKSQLIPLIDTATITVALKGEKPWKFTLWDGVEATSESSSFQKKFVLADNQSYDLKLSSLGDQYCPVGTVINSLQITATIITSAPGSFSESVVVYPNPSEDKVIIKSNATISRAYYYLSDLKGRIIRTLRIQENITELDISQLPAGAYVLWTKQHGSKQTWKIVKK